MDVNSIISVCTQKDIYAWSLVSKSILKNVVANKYIVIVPDIYFENFIHISPDQYTVIKESNVLEINIDYCRKKLKGLSANRAPWYYQQLLKISALEQYSRDSHLNSIIWDADTFIVKKLAFIGKPNIVIGHEKVHKPYFDLITELGFNTSKDISLISQFIQANHIQISGFIDILSNTGSKWYDRILSYPSDNELFFSEYETIGRYLLFHHNYNIYNANWSRDIPEEAIKLDGLESILQNSGYEYVGIEYPDLMKKISLLDKLKFYKFTYGSFGILKLILKKLIKK